MYSCWLNPFHSDSHGFCSASAYFLTNSVTNFSIAQNGNVTIGSSLTATDNSTPWLSLSGDFAFGFHPLNHTDLFLLSIWFAKVPDKTIVWYARLNNPAPRGSKVELIAYHGLVLTGPQGEELWWSDSIFGIVAKGVMNNTGNFGLQDSNFNKLWESFKSPSDTLLPSQKYGYWREAFFSTIRDKLFQRKVPAMFDSWR